jgi:DNA-binding transcriptional LysR family regulator
MLLPAGEGFMDLDRLKCFIAVAEELSFTRAADRLYLTQPAVSRKIQQLEKELDVLLLERRTTGVQLTAAGAALLTEAYSLAEASARAIDKVRNAGGHAAGGLRVGYYSVIGWLTGTLVSDFSKLYSHVTIDLYEMSSRSVEAAVERRDLDIGFVWTPSNFPSKNWELRYVELMTDQLVLAVPTVSDLARRASIAIRDLADFPVIMIPPETDPQLEAAVDALFRRHGVVAAPRIRTRAGELIEQFVRDGLGVALVGGANPHDPGVTYVPFEETLASFGVSLAHREDSSLIAHLFVEEAMRWRSEAARQAGRPALGVI